VQHSRPQAADRRPDATAPGGPRSRPQAAEQGPEAVSGGGQRGRPRSAEADRAILAAALELLAEGGLAAMSIEEIAARAGVG
jgi:AcrR family transcriptional regulator